MSGYAVTISAVDNLSKTLNRINQNAARSLAPFRKLGGAVTRLMRTTGVSGVARALGNVGRSARDAFQRLSAIIAPLGAISGAATLGGMYRMISAWSNWGTELGNVSRNMGITAQTLGSLQGAAQMAGSSGEALTNGLGALGQNLYDAVGGRNAGAVVMMNTLGVAFRKNATQARSVTDVLPELADKIASLKDPYAQAQAASTLFGGSAASMLPFLRRGSAGIREYQQAAERYLHITPQTAQAANTFREAQTRLTLAVEGFGNRISEKLAPILGPLLGQLADWIATNPKITEGINALGDGVQRFANWLKAIDWSAVGQKMQRWGGRILWVTNLLGGPGKAIRDILVLTAGGFAIRLAAPWIGLGFAIGKSVVKLALWVREMRTGTAAAKEAATAQEALAAASAGGKGGIGTTAMRAGKAIQSLGGGMASIGASIIPALVSPVGLAIAAVAALGVAAYELWKHWDAVKSAFKSNTGYIRTAAELLFPIPMAIIGHWTQLKTFFSDLWDGIKSAFTGAWSFISPIVDKLRDAVDFIGNSWLGQKIAGIADAGAQTVSGAANVGAQALDHAMDFGNTGKPFTPRGIRNNNPGNLQYEGQAGAHMETGTNRPRYAAFPTMDAGIQALQKQLVLYNNRGLNSVASILPKYAPATENDTDGYIASLSRQMHVAPNTPLDLTNPAVQRQMIYGISNVENGHDSVSLDQIDRAIGRAPAMQVASLSASLASSASSGSSTMSGSRAQDTVHRVEVSAAPGTRARVTDPTGSTRVVRNNVTRTVP
ncbi:hypothetical protein [Komagataeibacter xylinus]|uniref:hypothetical protein n=1 Tax=Komagataeibacter xylinus TaxID=28448 RepID=UPI001013D643